ncbi:MAG: tyrosine-protein phosphatase [Gammaproteobacteria bacterium]|nr:tyrosine-protein phosphatase [Gammaproteobacteria bacterium]
MLRGPALLPHVQVVCAGMTPFIRSDGTNCVTMCFSFGALYAVSQFSRPSRFLPFDGSINFRDFGGYPTAGGRPIRWGRLFRCGALSNLTESDHQRFGELEISVICRPAASR